MTTIARHITGGVDTHLDVHVAAALDERGALLGVESFADDAAGYQAALGLARGLRDPRARRRRRHRQLRGRTHPAPPCARASRWSRWIGPTASAAGARVSPIPKMPWRQPGPPKAAMPPDRPRPGTETSRPCGCYGWPGCSARRSRTQAINQMRSLISTAPDELRAELRDLSIYKVLTVASAYRHTGRTDVDGGDQAHAAHPGPPGPLPRRRGQGDRPAPQGTRRRDRTGAVRGRWGGYRRGLGHLGGRR